MLEKKKKPGGKLPHLWIRNRRWGFIFCKAKDREPPSLTRWVSIFGEVIIIFFLANLYLLAKAQAPYELPKTSSSLNSITQEIQAENFPFQIQWPIRGEISQNFSRWHPGLDIQATYGAKIRPFGPGVVTETGFRLGYGRVVKIQHKEGFSSIYAHLAKIQVKENQPVGLKTEVGSVGTSGWTTGAHLHLEIYENEKKVDPKNLLP
jgi:murein DD-endopeptidase MepM/ murein hydrolase activator NlpD